MNRLARENSLYLRQHADNPVDWYPWSDEAWQAAVDADKPVLVSIGYSACHWCHVMAHECFEDPYIAGLMNQHFVCIKLDREERPDLDRLYMEAVQMIIQRGGWPLNVFCLPDKRPFFGGTYFPPEDRGQGLIPWPQLLLRVSEHFQKNRPELLENADNIAENLAATARTPLGSAEDKAAPRPLDNAQLLPAAQAILQTLDRTDGGFGSAPKFPPSMTLNFLQAIRGSAAAESRRDFAQALDLACRLTLDRMARGGLFDQIGGGFARYSVDAQWIIPHFEKMLYDNALLLSAYARAYLRYRDPLYRAVAEETVAWLQREMRAHGGAFYASLDADSEGHEGKYTVWTPDEIRQILGLDNAERFCRAYAITESGNFENGTSNPVQTFNDFAKRTELAPLRAKLLETRLQRIPPGKDTKQLTAWNALLIRGLAEAAFAFNRPDWHTLAAEAGEFIWQNCAYHQDGYDRLYAVYYAPADTPEGLPSGPRFDGTFDDYAWLAEAACVLSEKAEAVTPGSASLWIHRAEALCHTIHAFFSDPDAPGCFTTARDAADIPMGRQKDWFDNATPSGHAAYAHALTRLHALTGIADYATRAAALRPAYATLAERAPSAASHYLAAVTAEAVGLAVIKFKDVSIDQLRDLTAALQGSDDQPQPHRPAHLFDASLDPQAPAGFQLCVGTQCLEPTQDPQALAAML
ncbi:MAG: thioredoxin domain-containing protein [Opitutales bacterium]